LISMFGGNKIGSGITPFPIYANFVPTPSGIQKKGRCVRYSRLNSASVTSIEKPEPFEKFPSHSADLNLSLAYLPFAKFSTNLKCLLQNASCFSFSLEEVTVSVWSQ